MNEVKLSGKIYTPRLRFTPSGVAVWEASVGVSRKVKDEWKTDFFDLVSIGKSAEEFADRLTDRCKVLQIRGALRQEKWEKDGVKHQRVRVYVFEADTEEAAKATPDEDLPF